MGPFGGYPETPPPAPQLAGRRCRARGASGGSLRFHVEPSPGHPLPAQPPASPGPPLCSRPGEASVSSAMRGVRAVGGAWPAGGSARRLQGAKSLRGAQGGGACEPECSPEFELETDGELPGSVAGGGGGVGVRVRGESPCLPGRGAEKCSSEQLIWRFRSTW